MGSVGPVGSTSTGGATLISFIFALAADAMASGLAATALLFDLRKKAPTASIIPLPRLSVFRLPEEFTREGCWVALAPASLASLASLSTNPFFASALLIPASELLLVEMSLERMVLACASLLGGNSTLLVVPTEGDATEPPEASVLARGLIAPIALPVKVMGVSWGVSCICKGLGTSSLGLSRSSPRSMSSMPRVGVTPSLLLWLSSIMFWLCGEGLTAPSFVAEPVTEPPDFPDLLLSGVLVEESMRDIIPGPFTETLPAFTRKSLLFPFLAPLPLFHVMMFL
mmetsp:Transcript_23704/g.52676  ORF Transcript_23704/g.52676 Transcript_23704/m.52676 type:complete len:284 (+) Transcript_23704:1450-2301(+)